VLWFPKGKESNVSVDAPGELVNDDDCDVGDSTYAISDWAQASRTPRSDSRAKAILKVSEDMG
jgi:hypothetical protein